MLNELKLVFSDTKNSLSAAIKRCTCCGNFTIIHKNRHIDKNGYWVPEFFCHNCGTKQ